jgi:hypothetical protein
MKPFSMKLLFFLLAALAVSSAGFVHLSIRRAQQAEHLHEQKEIQQDDEDYRRQIEAAKTN